MGNALEPRFAAAADHVLHVDPVRRAILDRNNVQVFGSGAQTLLFAHGFGCDQRMWRYVAPRFAGHYRVVLFDYVGAGQSDVSAYDAQRYATLDGYVQDVSEICAALDLDDAVFIGHSASAFTGAAVAQREPQRFSRMVMLCPSPSYLNDPPAYRGGFERADIDALLDLMSDNTSGWASTFAPLLAGDGEAGDELTRSFCALDPFIARRWARAVFFADHRAELASIAPPTLILQSADDALVPVSVGEYMRAHMPAGTLRLMPVSGHCPHMTHPEITAACIAGYLGAAPPAQKGKP